MVALNSNNAPPEHVLAWCRNLVDMTAHDGVWGIPRSGTAFRIDKKNKRLVLVVPGLDGDADFHATKHVFSFIGWDVVRDEKGKDGQNAKN